MVETEVVDLSSTHESDMDDEGTGLSTEPEQRVSETMEDTLPPTVAEHVQEVADSTAAPMPAAAEPQTEPTSSVPMAVEALANGGATTPEVDHQRPLPEVERTDPMQLEAAPQQAPTAVGASPRCPSEETPEPHVATPVKRRRSGTTPIQTREACGIADVVHFPVQTRVTLKCYLLYVPPQSRSVTLKMTAKVLQPQQKAVATVLIGDARGAMQLSMWGEKAQEFHGQLLQALEEAPDGAFPQLKLESAEVVAVPHAHQQLQMRRLQSSGAFQIQILEPQPLQITPELKLAITDFTMFGDKIRTPMAAHLHGVVDMVGSMRCSKDNVEMLELRITDPKSGLGIPIMLFGENATQVIPAQSVVTMYYIDFKAPLPDREDEGGFGWAYDTSMVLVGDACPKGGTVNASCKKVITIM